MPLEFKSAGEDFENFLTDLRRISFLSTRNQAYAMTRAVLHTFRAHVTPQAALDFANRLPPVMRAIFIDEWDLSKPVTPFPAQEALIDEVLTVRAEHNTAPRTAIADVAAALKLHMNSLDHAQMLAALPDDARRFWGDRA